ncbi:arylsulfatase [bacterium]|nr:arylsulfatase [bacterium]
MKSASTLILTLIATLLTSASAADKPHVLLIMVDDMGYGDPGCYNPKSKIPTPNIDGIAAQGMRFMDAHAPGPLCHMSRYGLLTGQYPFRTDVRRWPKHGLIGKDQITIASLLKKQGYHTEMVGKWHLGFEENGYDNPLPGGPVDVGFNAYFGIRASTDIPPYFYIKDRNAVSPPTVEIAARATEGWSPIQGEFWRKGLIAPGMKLHDVLPRFTEEAVTAIEKHAPKANEQPLMLYLAYPAPHTPWLPSEEYVGKSRASMYGDFMVMVDAMIGTVLDSLDKADMRDDTLVIFTADNGPVWYEEDSVRFGHDSCGPLRGMKADAWEGGHRMPFIARWPGQVQQGSMSEQTICFTDVLATLASITGYERKPNEGPDSYDFSDVLLGNRNEEKPVRPHLAMRSGSGFMTMRVGDWKLIDGLGSGGFSKPRRIKPEEGEAPGQLYNLKEDLGETTNLYAKHPEIVERLRKTLAEVAH